VAIYVLLAFDDDKEAKEFVKESLERGYAITTDERTNATKRYFDVRGVWKKPTQFCNPSDGHLKSVGKTEAGWTRGKNYGWWICAVCMKPSRRWAEANLWYTALGTNLLPQSEVAPEYRPPGWESPAEWKDLLPLLNPSGKVPEFQNDPRTKQSYVTYKEERPNEDDSDDPDHTDALTGRII